MARKYSISELRHRALDGDVSWHMQQLYSSRIRDRDPVVLAILGLGHAIESKNWILSTSEDKMRDGTATREQRIERAIEQARLAGVEVTDIADIFGLNHMLPPEMFQTEQPNSPEC